ncbi:MAG: rhodanese-like domain-containing protein [Proteobacteria bacterium]|nr:rhodanese-like domain-containing protein [Pseudomonadota bacterium]
MKKSWIVWICAAAVAALIAAPAAWAWGEKELEIEALAVKFLREVERGGYGVVTVPELQGWLDESRDMLVVDTMPYEDSYKKNHIPGAVQHEFPIPEVEEMDAQAMKDFRKLLGPDKDRVLVFYCGFTKCARSHNGAMWARRLGYKNVYRCPGGIKGWKEGEYPVSKVEG